MDAAIPDIFTERRHLGATGERVWRVALGLGIGLLAAGAALAFAGEGGARSFYFAWLLAFAYVLSLALGGLFFVVLQHLTRAGWSVVVRRIAEAAAGTLPLMAVLVLPVLFGAHQLYHWSHAEVVAADPLLEGKAAYLNMPFFVARWVIYVALWWLLARFFVGQSLAQDETGEAELTVRMQERAAPAMVVFGLTVTFAAVDLMMTLDPHWFSTIFGVYYFAGCAVSVMALMIVAARAAQRAGLLRRAITVEHYHDLGKLLFAFNVFWAYIGFSQYMLYWYANIPEETGWLLRRQTHGWGWVGLLLVLGHFAAPFAVLLSRGPKRRPRLLAGAAAWMLLMQWVDLYWIVIPEFRPQGAMPRPAELLVTAGVVGVWVAFAVWRLRGRPLVPERDPRLGESLGFENA